MERWPMSKREFLKRKLWLPSQNTKAAASKNMKNAKEAEELLDTGELGILQLNW